MTSYQSARELARRLGIKIGTLAKWRRTGRGPDGWIYASKTLVIYPIEEIERFLRSRAHPEGVPPVFGRRLADEDAEHHTETRLR